MSGEQIAEGTPAADLAGGFLAGCFVAPPPPNEDFEFGFSVWQCPTQAFWCDQIAFLYNAWFSDLITQCTARFTGATITVVPQSSLYPAYALIVHPAYACVVTAGTDTIGQGLVQALQLLQGPQDYGSFGTAKIWYDFATQLMGALGTANALDGRPIMFAGHSYGGAAALVAIARISISIPKAELRYITYGCPKPGDTRLTALLRGRYDGLSLVNDGDLITTLPPTGDVMDAMSSLSPFGFVFPWTLWDFPPETTLMFGTSLLKNTYQRFDSAALSAYIASVITTGKLATVPAHLIAAYQKRIALRCASFLPTAVELVLDWITTSTVTNLVITPCCPSGLPQHMTFTFSGVAPPNDFLNGLTFPIGWQGGGSFAWGGNFLTPDGLANVFFSCVVGLGWELLITGSVTLDTGNIIPSTCATMVFVGILQTVHGGSMGTMTITHVP